MATLRVSWVGEGEKRHAKQSFLVYTLPQEETIKGVRDDKARKELKRQRFWSFGESPLG